MRSFAVGGAVCLRGGCAQGPLLWKTLEKLIYKKRGFNVKIDRKADESVLGLVWCMQKSLGKKGG